MSLNIESKTDGQKTWIEAIPMKRPIGILLMLGVMVLILVFEPALTWFFLPAFLLGILIAVIIHWSKSTPRLVGDQEQPAIQMARIPVKGAVGLVFAIGTMAMFFAALPEVRWFLLLALPAGVIIGMGLHLWYKRHPLP
jgi:hypothetical protein